MLDIPQQINYVIMMEEDRCHGSSYGRARWDQGKRQIESDPRDEDNCIVKKTFWGKIYHKIEAIDKNLYLVLVLSKLLAYNI